jgi:CHASE2 domain-containing sensor protein
MTSSEDRAARWRGWWACSTLIALAGVYLVLVPLGAPLRRIGYDLPFLAAPPARHTNVVLVYVDDASLRDLGRRPDGGLDRRWYAELLRRLTDDGARLVVFDIAFTYGNDGDETDRALAAALRANGRVVLASTYEAVPEGDMVMRRVLPPDARFGTNAAATGVAFLEPDADHVVRRLPTEIQLEGLSIGEDSLVWAAARVANAWPARADATRERERWLRHYTPPNQTLTAFKEVSIRAAVATNGLPPGFFRGKAVFIGARRSVGPIGQERDRFATPFSAWVEGWPDSPGVALQATAFVNLERDDWIEPAGPGGRIGFVLLAGLLLSLAVFHLRPLAALCAGAGGAGMLITFGFVAQERFGVSLPWLVPVAVQLPLALVWAWGRNWFKPGRPRAFISYRRKEGEGSGYALGLWHGLRAHGIASHLDVEGLRTDEWKRQLERRIKSVPNFILLITPGSLDPGRIAGPAGAQDTFRWEMEMARNSGRNIIVVLIEPARLPGESDALPDSLRWLQDPDHQLQAWTYRHDDPSRLLSHVLGRLEGRPGSRFRFARRLRWMDRAAKHGRK